MNRLIMLFLFMLGALLLTACSPEQKEIDSYIDQVTDWNTAEYKIISEYEDAYQNEKMSEEEYIAILDKAYKNYPGFLQKVEAFRPDSERLADIHRLYMKSLKSYLESMKLDRAYYEADTEDEQNRLDQEFSAKSEEAASISETFEKRLEKLASQNFIDLEWQNIE
ncbi:hypothetical protein CEF21_04635 [Bacillus sp. FJAT-42376]|uniref:hypothetical protein n=1 Tax=Bacillus sp. FJAT-42376 TaxID=2014076 RepID=UPI000F4E4F51|nr:hypothetical protein [Bacillus sp. FJAT-42376]AZB41641.1 hypothetical protein CEF21_04635 [Bacillus sp. FJAT-42376]